MEFVDVSQCKIVNMNRFSTFKIKLDGDEYLDSPVSESSQYIRNLLRCSFKTPSVVYRISVQLEEPTLDDFEVICENVVAAIFTNNIREDVLRTEEELKFVLNKLPSNRWVLKQPFVNRVNCDVTTLLHAAKHGWHNRNLNIFIETTSGEFKYELIAPEGNK